jgi:hypothetical protein
VELTKVSDIISSHNEVNLILWAFHKVRTKYKRQPQSWEKYSISVKAEILYFPQKESVQYFQFKNNINIRLN